jgi:hypothetical protein
MSSQAKTVANSTSTSLGPFSLSGVWLLRWAQEQTPYVITGKCTYCNDFESRLKPSAQRAHEFLYFYLGERGYFGWMTIWVLIPDWRSLRMQSCDCGQTLRWSCRAWWLCPLVMQLDYICSLCNNIVSVGCANIWYQLCSYMVSVYCAAIWCRLVVPLNGVCCAAIGCRLVVCAAIGCQ